MDEGGVESAEENNRSGMIFAAVQGETSSGNTVKICFEFAGSVIENQLSRLFCDGL
jgi:hypothetical protein